MSRTRYYTATTLDGYIADEANSLDWLFTRQRQPDGPLNYGDFIKDIGALAMGATTYEWILDHEDGRWPYDLPSWVFTHRELPVIEAAAVTFVSGDVSPVHAELTAAAQGKDVWIVGGGDLAGQFADAGLLDEVIVQIAPVATGRGAPLLPRRLELRLEETGRNVDFVVARFSVVKEP
jgi:dihydrofolate reductase